MEINTYCPACGAAVGVPDDASQFRCPFCGNNFSVDQSGPAPILSATIPEEMKPEPLPEPPDLSSTDGLPQPTLLSVPTPPVEPSGPLPPLAPPPPYTPPAMGEPPKRNNTTWLIVAIAVAAVVCMMCVCLVGAALIFNYSPQ